MIKNKLSIVIPARNELFLNETVEDILKKATGDFELIVILDGYWPQVLPKEDHRLILVHRERQGMRSSINSGISMSSGEFVMKTDGHCLFSEGFDETLKVDCEKDWIVVPRRYALDSDSWSIKKEKMPIDYEYLRWPYQNNKTIHGSRVGLHAESWNERTISRVDRQIDETPSLQGSCWFTTREHFTKRIGGLQNFGYGTFIGESQELCLKTQLGESGKVMVNKKVYYGHLWKGEQYRKKHLEQIGVPYTRIGQKELKAGNDYCVNYWLHDKWEKRKHNLSWLIDKFDMPTWPKDWEKNLKDGVYS